MPRASDSTTDTYLDVLRTLGVTDAALRRHHDAPPETPLRVAIDGDRGAPTADLLSALGATGRVLDLRDGLAAGDGERLTAALGRFGFAVECSPAADADESEDLELRVRDAVTGDVESLQTAPGAAAAETTLREELLAPIDVELAELLDGRHLVAEVRELRALADSHGERIEPFDDPLLVPEAAVDVDAEEPSAGLAPAGTGEFPSVGAMWGADASAESTPSADPSESGSVASGDSPAAADGESFGEALAEADDATTDSIEDALSRGGPSTHTIESDDDLAAASETTVGGGPRRTVSTTGIDEVFDQLESSTADAESTQDAHESAATQTTTTTMSDASDAPTEASASSDDAGGTAEGLSGGPKRTVSTTSADDILARATGERDFETIAAEEGDADPDAVLAEGEVPPALEDSGVTPASSEAPDAEPDVDESAPPETSRTDSGPDEVDVAEVAGAAEESASAAEESAGAADRPPADPAQPGSTSGSAESSPDAADEPTADEMVAAAGASGSADAAASAGDDADSEPSDPTDAEPSDDADPAAADAADSAAADDADPAAADAADPVAADAADPVAADAADPVAADDAESATAPSASNTDRDEAVGSPDPNATPEPADLGEDLLDEDVELREGAGSVDEPDALDAEPVDAVDDADGPAAADGPLAARGGLRPDDPSETGRAHEPTASESAATESTSVDRRSDDGLPVDDDPAAGDRRTAGGSGGGLTSDDSTAGAPETGDPTSGHESPATDEEPNADVVAEEDSTGDGGDAGLVGRITSTIFGR